MKRPRCNNCGKKLDLVYKPYRPIYFAKIPSHCPYCGEKLTLEKGKALNDYEDMIFSFFFILCIVAFITAMILSNIF